MNPYKLKHIPTGLFYQPYKSRGSHLSKTGKIYQTNLNGLSDSYKNAKYHEIESSKYKFTIRCQFNSKIYKETNDILNWYIPNYKNNNGIYYGDVSCETLLSDWIIEEI